MCFNFTFNIISFGNNSCTAHFRVDRTRSKIMNALDIQQQLADQRRGRYVRVSDVDRRLLIDTYKKGEDFIALAKKLNIKRSTGELNTTMIPGITNICCFSSKYLANLHRRRSDIRKTASWHTFTFYNRR